VLNLSFLVFSCHYVYILNGFTFEKFAPPFGVIKIVAFYHTDKAFSIKLSQVSKSTFIASTRTTLSVLIFCFHHNIIFGIFVLVSPFGFTKTKSVCDGLLTFFAIVIELNSK